MHSVLFVAFTAHPDDWVAFQAKSKAKLEPTGDERRYAESCVRLADNVWLLDLSKSVEPLGWLTSMAQVSNVPYGLLPFAEKPEWLPNDCKPNWTWR
jgi:hypothetical protein